MKNGLPETSRGILISNLGRRNEGSERFVGITMKQRIIGKEIVKDIARRMTNAELTKKYNLSEGELRSIFRHLAKLRERRIQKLAGDLKSGMASSDIMTKYQ